ncbi:hypothetical protein G5I_04065 [Acromyrmex echinatior]|uniref:Uncharacterized protein n=1 Tax=Acromyrmex echinatior TaxID=103372 RepID=F4WED4_ACREC|nr:hypothetical protein G5I_04065 [Acromyrmex echinatior]
MQSMLNAKFLVVPNARTLRLDAFYTTQSDALQKLFTGGKKGSRYIEGEGAIEPTTGFFQARMSSLNYTGCPCCYGNPSARRDTPSFSLAFVRRPEEAETKRGAPECVGCRPLNCGISESWSHHSRFLKFLATMYNEVKRLRWSEYCIIVRQVSSSPKSSRVSDRFVSVSVPSLGPFLAISFPPACDNDECFECIVLERDIFSRIVALVSGTTLERPVKRRAVHTTTLGGSFRNSGQSELAALDHSAHGPGHDQIIYSVIVAKDRHATELDSARSIQAPAGDRQVSADVLALTAHMLGPPLHFSDSKKGTGLLPVTRVAHPWELLRLLYDILYHVESSTLKLLENRDRDDHYSHFSPIACHIETIPNERLPTLQAASTADFDCHSEPIHNGPITMSLTCELSLIHYESAKS